MTGFYNLLDTIKTELKANEFVNSVTYGNLSEVDLNKDTAFPLSHFIVNSFTYGENVITYNVSLLCMDVVNESKDSAEDIFIGQDDTHDILNTQHWVVIRVLDALKKGDLYLTKYQLSSDPSVEPFVDRFENKLAGWAVTFDVMTTNDTLCA